MSSTETSSTQTNGPSALRWAYNGMDCFQDPQHLIFNNHLFDEGVSMASRSVTEFPEFESATYSIEYCRIFQKDGVGEFKAK